MAQRSLYDLINGEFASGNPALAKDAANPDAVVARQRFIDYFAGNSVDTNAWTQNGSATMSITENGLKLTGGAGRIGFNDRRHYSHQGSSCIWTSYTEDITSGLEHGLSADKTSFGVDVAKIFLANGYTSLWTAHSSQSGTTLTSDSTWGVWATYKVEQNNGSTNGYINGVLKGTRVDNQPREAMQPQFAIYSASGISYSNYCEAWNH